MIKASTITILLTVIFNTGFGQFIQIEKLDSFKHQLNLVEDDSERVLMMAELAWHYHIWNPDSGIVYGQKALALAKQIRFPRGEARALIGLAQVSSTQGDLPKSLEFGFQALRIVEENHYLPEKAMCFTSIGDELSELSGNSKTITYFNQAKNIYESLADQAGMGFWESLNAFKTAEELFWTNPNDSTLVYMQNFLDSTKPSDYWYSPALIRIADMQFRLGKRMTALDHMRQGIEIAKTDKNYYQISYACSTMAGYFKTMNQRDSSIFYAMEAFSDARHMGFIPYLMETSLILADQYEPTDLSKALYFRKLYDSANNVLFGEGKVRSLQKIVSEEQQRQRNEEAERIAYQSRMKQFILLTGLGIFLGIAFLLYRNNRQKNKVNLKLQQQKEEIQQTLMQLKATESQLIQSEKMASLGELTAGIAHEIQNPLNFVNNFSEVNKELIGEMKTEMENGNVEEVKRIADDIGANEEKISHHGRRADAIVKSMLQHSRLSSGKKEPTDINGLADEYLRLAYHGLRAKDKTFHATWETNYDESIGKINVVSQDIGRVLLNLYNNAFYAVAEKGKEHREGYEPLVSVTTTRINSKIEISIKDNGNGIPSKILNKIFQPFFTTKPAGQGTGLGLSLSYDIVKAHGGEIRVDSVEGGFTEFVVQIPAG